MMMKIHVLILWLFLTGFTLGSKEGKSQVEEKEDEKCTICYESFSEVNKKIQTVCNELHPYCQNCFLNNFIRHKNQDCPSCRNNILDDLYQIIIETNDVEFIKDAIAISPELLNESMDNESLYAYAKHITSNKELLNALRSYYIRAIRLYNAVRTGNPILVEKLFKSNVLEKINPNITRKEKKDLPLALALKRLGKIYKILDFVLKTQNAPPIKPLLNILKKRENYEQVIKLLLENGANVNQANLFDHTPLFEAVNKNNFELAKFILQNQADPNLPKYQGGTAYILPIWRARTVKMAKLLIDYGAEYEEIEDDENLTILSHAAENGNAELVCFYARLDLDVNYEDDSSFSTPLMHAISEANSRKTVKVLLQHGAEVNYFNLENICPLQAAILKNNKQILNLLLEFGANPFLELEESTDLDEDETAQPTNSESVLETAQNINPRLAPLILNGYMKYLKRKRRENDE